MDKKIEDHKINLMLYGRLVLISLPLAGMLIFWGAYLAPRLIGVRESFVQLGEKREEVDELAGKYAYLSGLDPERLKMLVEKSRELLPSSSDPGRLLLRIQRLEEETGVVVTDLNAGGAGSNIKMALIGDEKSVKNFLIGLKREDEQIVSIVSLGINSDGDNYNASVELKVPFEPLPSEIAAVDKPLPELSENQQEVLEELENLVVYKEDFQVEPSDDIVPKENPFQY